MSLDIQGLHKLIDEWAARQPSITVTGADILTSSTKAPAPEKPKDKRVVRTKSSGDRVYLLDETKKSRQWISKPELLDELGFTMADVTEIDDSDLIRYQMGGPIYKVNG